MRTRLYILAFLCLLGAPVSAHPNPAQSFAACAGRFSAEMEHAWLLGTSHLTQHQTSLATFVSLVEASAPTGSRRSLFHLRVEAKLAHARLLHAGTFVREVKRAAFARATAAHFIRECRKLLLGG
ncbi:MAG: hypothetical protein AAF943_08395 [Pseudomonadota bacterium]